jgi:hypothetical protein
LFFLSRNMLQTSKKSTIGEISIFGKKSFFSNFQRSFFYFKIPNFSDKNCVINLRNKHILQGLENETKRNETKRKKR